MSRFMIAAPSSGAGKTTVTLALMRLLQRAKIEFQPAKSGPDYIDPGFHSVAAGTPSVNLDAWAMPADLIGTLAGSSGLVVEAAMGLFDGAGKAGRGSAADLAKILDIPVILVVDAAKTAHSIAALVTGFRDYDPQVTLAGVFLNRVGSARHLDMLTQALNGQNIKIFGHLMRSEAFALPERHLGLVQAGEIDQLEPWIDHIATALHPSLDFAALRELSGPTLAAQTTLPRPPAQHIAIAADRAFAFRYPHQMKGWRDAGAQLSFFSPLADEPPPKAAQYIFLPGGYPELHAGQLAAASPILRPGDERSPTGSFGVDSRWTCREFVSCGIVLESTRTIVDFESSGFGDERFQFAANGIGVRLRPLRCNVGDANIFEGGRNDTDGEARCYVGR